jgi:hypothetical protein
MSRREDYSDYDSNCNCNRCIKKREPSCSSCKNIYYEQNRCKNEQNRCKRIRNNNCSCRDCFFKKNRMNYMNHHNCDDFDDSDDCNNCKNSKVIVINIK